MHFGRYFVNFYSHHIGDFNNATRHLSRLERSIYRDMLELYYDTEKPLTDDLDKLARRCLVADEERGALREVLNEFFVAQDDGYHNCRADKEIAAYQRMGEGGKRGAAKRWAKGEDSHPIPPPLPPVCKANANHKPITNNQEPETRNQKPETKNHGFIEYKKPNDIDDELWLHFVAHRKKKKAAITEIAMNGILREAGKAGYTLTQALTRIMERNWTGFESDWVADKRSGKQSPQASADWVPPEMRRFEKIVLAEVVDENI